MIPTDTTLENMTLNITQEIHVDASLEITFESLLDELGPYNQTPDGRSLNLRLEPWPGGRWFRDLGDGNGHLWAHVQAIKRPTLLEFTGPLMISSPVVSNVQYRLSESGGGTLITFRHTALGYVSDDHKAGMRTGWAAMNENARNRAEARAASGRK